MKKNNLFTGLTVAFLIIILATGCKKDNNNSGGDSMTGTVNGTAWQSKYMVGLRTTYATGVDITGISVKNGDTTMIRLSIDDSIMVNEPSQFELSDAYYIKSDGTTYDIYAFYSGSGTLTLSSWDRNAHKIAGTFSATLINQQDQSDMVKIENGHFSSSYTVQ